MTGQCDFVVQRNATFKRVINWKDDQEANIDVTNMHALMQVRPYPNGPVIVELTDAETSGAYITIGNSDGNFTLVIEREITAVLKPMTAYYDLDITDTQGFTFRLLEGNFTVVDAITLGTFDDPG